MVALAIGIFVLIVNTLLWILASMLNFGNSAGMSQVNKVYARFRNLIIFLTIAGVVVSLCTNDSPTEVGKHSQPSQTWKWLTTPVGQKNFQK